MNRLIRRPVLLVLAVPLLLGACASAGAPSAPPSTAPSVPPATGAPPADSPPGAGEEQPPEQGGLPGEGQLGGEPKLVVPQPGQQMLREVAVSEIRHELDGRRVVLNVRWWSGVEPCSVLDSVDVVRDGTTIGITLREGTSDPEAMCIAMAMEKVTVVDLGELPAGTYTIEGRPSDVKPVTIVVP